MEGCNCYSFEKVESEAEGSMGECFTFGKCESFEKDNNFESGEVACEESDFQ